MDRIDTLPGDEISELFSGDPRGFTKAQLWDQYHRLVYRMVNKIIWIIPTIKDSKEDLIQHGFLMLHKALANWRPERGEFIQYLWKCLYREVWREACREYRAYVRPGKKENLDDHFGPYYLKFGNMNMDDNLPPSEVGLYLELLRDVESSLQKDAVQIEELLLAKLHLEKLLANFNPEDRQLFQEYFLQGYKMPEMAKQRGCSRQNIHYKITRIRQQICQLLDEVDYEQLRMHHCPSRDITH